MLIPALFVAEGVRKATLPGAPAFDIIIFVAAADIDRAHGDWANKRGIILRHDVDIASVRDIAILQKRLSPATLIKLLIPDLLAGRYQKLLYLDADLVIKDDISALFQLDMGELAVAAVPSGRVWVDVTEEKKDRWLAHFQALGMTAPYRYFNAGVLLVDVAGWNRQQLTRRTLDFLRKNAGICHLPDEDALNAVLDGDLLELSPIWNAPPLRLRTLAPGDLQPVIVHYSGPLKPWVRFRKSKGLRQDMDAYRLYRDFLRDTPWPGWLRQQWGGRDLMRSLHYEARMLIRRMVGKGSAFSPAERQSRQAILRRYYAEMRFADVEQGLTFRDGSRLRRAGAPPASDVRGAGLGSSGALKMHDGLRGSAPARP